MMTTDTRTRFAAELRLWILTLGFMAGFSALLIALDRLLGGV